MNRLDQIQYGFKVGKPKISCSTAADALINKVLELESVFENQTIKNILEGKTISLDEMKAIAKEFTIRSHTELPLLHIKNAIKASSDEGIDFRLRIFATFFEDNSEADFRRRELFQIAFDESKIRKSRKLISESIGDQTDVFYEALEWLNQISLNQPRELSSVQISQSTTDTQINNNLKSLAINFKSMEWIRETLTFDSGPGESAKYMILVNQALLVNELKTIMIQKFDYDKLDFNQMI